MDISGLMKSVLDLSSPQRKQGRPQLFIRKIEVLLFLKVNYRQKSIDWDVTIKFGLMLRDIRILNPGVFNLNLLRELWNEKYCFPMDNSLCCWLSFRQDSVLRSSSSRCQIVDIGLFCQHSHNWNWQRCFCIVDPSCAKAVQHCWHGDNNVHELDTIVDSWSTFTVSRHFSLEFESDLWTYGDMKSVLREWTCNN